MVHDAFWLAPGVDEGKTASKKAPTGSGASSPGTDNAGDGALAHRNEASSSLREILRNWLGLVFMVTMGFRILLPLLAVMHTPAKLPVYA